MSCVEQDKRKIARGEEYSGVVASRRRAEGKIHEKLFTKSTSQKYRMLFFFYLTSVSRVTLQVVQPTSTERFVVSTTEGSPARLEIRLCSDPKPTLVAWEWGSTRLHAGEVLESRYRALDLKALPSEDCYIAILEFTHTVKEDQRLYYVIVENDHGSDRRSLMLRVDEPAQVRLATISASRDLRTRPCHW